MYYKVLEGTETFLNLEKIWEKIGDCNKKAGDLVKELGFERYGKSQFFVGGGISCIESETKPKGFKKVGDLSNNLYYPRADNKLLLERFNALPKVSYDDFNKVIGYKEQSKGQNFYGSYGCKKVDNCYLIEIDRNCDYTPKEDMIEILWSEYKLLYN